MIHNFKIILKFESDRKIKLKIIYNAYIINNSLNFNIKKQALFNLFNYVVQIYYLIMLWKYIIEVKIYLHLYYKTFECAYQILFGGIIIVS